MIDKLQNKGAIKYFYLIIGLLLVTLFLTAHLLIPFIRGEAIVVNITTLKDVIDKLFTSTLVTVGLATFIFWLTPKNERNAQIKILQPIEIGETLIRSRNGTEKWWFNGGSGRYTRAVTLPYLAKLARQKGKSIDVTLQILNPANVSLCTKYSNYRNSLRTAAKERRSCKSVQMDLLATIVSAYIWKSEQPLLKLTVGLKDNFSLFRTDLSSHSAVITKEDPQEPAILYETGTFFYDAQHEDLRQSLDQVNKLDTNISFYGIKQADLAKTKALLMQLNLISLVQDDDITKIIALAKSQDNPYA